MKKLIYPLVIGASLLGIVSCATQQKTEYANLPKVNERTWNLESNEEKLEFITGIKFSDITPGNIENILEQRKTDRCYFTLKLTDIYREKLKKRELEKEDLAVLTTLRNEECYGFVAEEVIKDYLNQ